MRGVLVVFLLSGIWHGANWTFVVWGVIHGLASVASMLTTAPRKALVRAIRLDRVPALHVAVQRFIVVSIVVLAFVFFRAQSLGEALMILGRLTDWRGTQLGTLWTLGLPRFEMVIALLSIAVLFATEWSDERKRAWVDALWSQRPVRWATYLAGFYVIGCFGVFGRVEFIYFQF